MKGVLVLANISNGLAFRHDNVCCFQSNHGHNAKMGYFRMDAMPYSVVIWLLRGGRIEIVDATSGKKPLTDALKFGLPAWCLVFNRALRLDARVCEWQTREMTTASRLDVHKPLVQTIRKLEKLYGNKGPCVIGKNIGTRIVKNFPCDDSPSKLKELVKG